MGAGAATATKKKKYTDVDPYVVAVAEQKQQWRERARHRGEVQTQDAWRGGLPSKMQLYTTKQQLHKLEQDSIPGARRAAQ